MQYTVFIDESGEAGIKQIRSSNTSGASPYLTLGATLVPNTKLGEIRQQLSNFQKSINKKSLHTTELAHVQKVRFGELIAQSHLLCFGVISNKSTLRGYSNDIQNNPKKYYNKCVQYLFERVGMFAQKNKISPIDIDFCFESGNYDYEGMKGLISRCKRNPIHPNTKFLANISLTNITSKTKKDEPLLQTADFVAHALYRCVDKTKGNLGVLEPRYLNEIKDRFYCNPSNSKIVKHGIYAIHKVSDLSLDEKMEKYFEELSACKS